MTNSTPEDLEQLSVVDRVVSAAIPGVAETAEHATRESLVKRDDDGNIVKVVTRTLDESFA